MRIQGLGDIFGDGDVSLDQYLEPAIPDNAVYASEPSAANDGFDWGGLLQTAVKTYGTVKTIDLQADIQRQKAVTALQYPYGTTMTAYGVQSPRTPTYPPNFTPFQGGGTPFNIPVPAMIIGVGLLAYALLSGR